MTLSTLFPKSLKLRLMAAAALWVLPILLLAALLLHIAFLRHLERQIDSDLMAFERDLLAAAHIDGAGALQLDYQPGDPRFSRPLSGWYWQIAMGGTVVKQSPSAGPLGPGALALLSTIDGIVELPGPGGRELRILRRQVSLPGTDAPIILLVAAPCDEIDDDLRQFSLHIALTFLILGAVFMVAVYLQVGFGLRPLGALRREIAAIRSGRRDHLDNDVPSEIAPVTKEVNALIDHNKQILDRARHEASNLAHALKNPLSVLSHEIGQLPSEQRPVLAGQVDTIAAHVERILKRIRTAGPSGAGQQRVAVAGIVDDLVFSLNVIYRERGLSLAAAIDPALNFAGDAEDLAEMLGNLADNACKWARSRVEISAVLDGDRLLLTVADDGPGIAPTEREIALGRGRRLDERVPGSGLGLDIVREIVTLYRGRLTLADAALGGLAASLDLPAAL
jgi:signal transduction histidine kinase